VARVSVHGAILTKGDSSWEKNVIIPTSFFFFFPKP
jgi:hypothetical protein